MPIPDFQTIMLPLHQSCADGQEHGLRETIAALATTFQLTEEKRQELLPGGLPVAASVISVESKSLSSSKFATC